MRQRLLFLLPAVVISTACAQGQSALANADSVITRALRPIPRERVEITTDSSSLFPGVVVRRGHRVPLAYSMHDVRIESAAVVIRDTARVVVTALKDFPAAWHLLQDARPVAVAQATETLITALELTGLIRVPQIIYYHDTPFNRRQYATLFLEDSTALDSLAKPTATAHGDTIHVRFFLDEFSGVYVVDAALQPSGHIELKRTLLSHYRL